MMLKEVKNTVKERPIIEGASGPSSDLPSRQDLLLKINESCNLAFTNAVWQSLQDLQPREPRDEWSPSDTQGVPPWPQRGGG